MRDTSQGHVFTLYPNKIMKSFQKDEVFDSIRINQMIFINVRIIISSCLNTGIGTANIFNCH